LRCTIGCLAFVVLWRSLSLAQDTPQAYVGARIIPMSGAEIPDGVLVVHQGKIAAIGPARSTSVPAGA